MAPGKLLSSILAFFALLPTAEAKELFGPEAGVVPFGMGRAYSAAADDWLALYYNPAGLALVKGVELQAADLKVGASTDVVESISTIDNLSDDSKSTAEKLNSYAGKHILGQISNHSQITMPHFALGAAYEVNAEIDMQNVSYPVTRMRYEKDFSISLGTAAAFGPRKALRIGGKLSFINRRGGTQNVGINEITGSKAALIDRFSHHGTGWGGTIGMQYRIPTAGRTEITVSSVWHDIGKTTFGSFASRTRPTRKEDNLVFGTAVRFPIGGKKNRRLERRYGPDRSTNHLTIAADYSHANLGLDKEPFAKHLHVGMNLVLPLVSLQLGMNQSSLTYGASFDIGIVRVSAASYGEELGSFAGQRRDRRYLLSIASAFSFK